VVDKFNAINAIIKNHSLSQFKFLNDGSHENN